MKKYTLVAGPDLSVNPYSILNLDESSGFKVGGHETLALLDFYSFSDIQD